MQSERLCGRVGDRKGIEKHLSQQVIKKLSKGRSVAEIADELEEDEETIRRIMENCISDSI